MQFLTYVRHLLAARHSERGASAVEYGLLVAGIAALIVATVFLFGGFMNELLGDSCGTITTWVTKNAEC
ncbi:Flp family type IVb pilin [Nocardioides daphniae]|uniref:Flp family type IVb pilin n=1 Tax=Nocardioides daphniae TaxID=402297 RepID=A0A4P7UA89_9ACTN|nr:Flp family type IVb pilin [Nocardioides daphniae]QCC76980.1 Flp family type IVb pilin [Nocardioides daphniae]GGD18337.1 hypothetical protein GCM10007231_16790 [Nocardioides daphniae]